MRAAVRVRSESDPRSVFSRAFTSESKLISILIGLLANRALLICHCANDSLDHLAVRIGRADLTREINQRALRTGFRFAIILGIKPKSSPSAILSSDHFTHLINCHQDKCSKSARLKLFLELVYDMQIYCLTCCRLVHS